jgi:hypothetical protein
MLLFCAWHKGASARINGAIAIFSLGRIQRIKYKNQQELKMELNRIFLPI